MAIRSSEPNQYGVVNTQWEHEICEEEVKREREKLMKEVEQIQKDVREDIF